MSEKPIYTEAQLKENTLKYFNNDELATDVWVKKYALQDNDGNYLELTPDDMHHRLAREFARIESKYPNPISEEEIYELFKNFKYIVPQGSPMEGIGNDYRIQSLSNCFVIDSPADSYGGIMKTDQEQAQIMKRRGGVGFDISPIRPKGCKTSNAAKTTDGISIFMERFSNTTREVAQNGRRGALLESILISHPEIETFIDIKKDLKKVTGANISIRITDDFMKALKNNEKYILKWPVDSNDPKITKEVDAQKIWNKIIDAVWTSAEPGVLFWDTIKKYTPSDIYKDYGFSSLCVNPCLSGDTNVTTDKGNITIKELSENFDYFKDNVKILSYNEKHKDLEYKELDDAFLTKRNANIIEIELEDNTKIKLTPDHKVYTKNRKWIKASMLTPEDILLKIE
jgi:ribonucleoside-diphosphate reductase alpha chain